MAEKNSGAAATASEKVAALEAALLSSAAVPSSVNLNKIIVTESKTLRECVGTTKIVYINRLFKIIYINKIGTTKIIHINK